MPIKSFLGHRSQASPEIRHISGQNIKEFKEFLQNHENIFVVRDNYVVLRTVLNKVDENGVHTKIRRVVEETPTDPYLMQQLVTQLEEAILHLAGVRLTHMNGSGDANGSDGEESVVQNKENRPETANGEQNCQTCSLVSIEHLFAHMRRIQQSELFGRMINSTSDLCTMLKMNSKIFYVHSNMVAITEDRMNRLQTDGFRPEVGRTTGNFFPVKIMTPSPPLANHSQTNVGDRSLPLLNSGCEQFSLPNSRPASAGGTNGGCVMGSLQPRIRSQIIKTISENSNGVLKMRPQEMSPAYSSPNLTSPAILTVFNGHPPPPGLHPMGPPCAPIFVANGINGGSHGYLNQMGSQPHLLPTPIQHTFQPVHPHLAGPPSQSLQMQHMPLPPPSAHPHHHPSMIHVNPPSQDAQLLRMTTIVTNGREADEIVEDIIQHRKIVAVDLEGVNLSTTGHVTVIQMAVFTGDLSIAPSVLLFDVLLNKELPYRSLKRLFESEHVVKVFSDCRSGSAALNSRYGIELRNVFDIQSAHAVLEQQNQGKPVYKSRFVPLPALCETYAGSTVLQYRCKDSLKKSCRKDPNYWSHRPFTEEMLIYAGYDVFAILPRLYFQTQQSIRPEYFPLLEELNYEAIWAKIRPEEVRSRKKHRKTEMEVTDLKHKLFNTDARLVVLSNREIRLLRSVFRN